MSSHNRVDRLRVWAGRRWPEILAALAPLLVFWRLVFGGQVLYWALPALQFVPWRVLINDALRQGRLPLWTPLLGMGAPLMANHQSAVLYPPNWLALLLPPEVAIGLLAVLHLSFAGVGMARLARRLGLSNFGVAITGLAFCLSGYLTGRLWFITINNALAWLPWIVLAATPSTPVAKPGWGVWLSALIALQLLAGHAQSSFYTLLLAAAWLALHSLNNADRWRALAINGLRFGLAALFAFSLTAVQLLPTYELLRQSPRADAAEYEFAVTYSLWPWRILTFAAPDLFGHPADHNYVGYATYWEDHAYLGLLPLLFAAYAAYCVFRIPFFRPTQYALRNTSLFLLLAIAVSLILALGKNTPIFPFFYRYVPGFDLFQAPARMLIWYTFAVSLLAGIGADRWQASARKRYWARLGIAGSAGMVILGFAGTLVITNENATVLARGVIGAAAVAVGTFILILAQPLAPNRWRWLALAFITLDLGLAAVRLNPAIDPAFYRLQPAFAPNEGRLYQFADDEYQVKFNDFFRFKSFDDIDPQSLRNSLLPNLSALSGLASANNFDPLRPERYVLYLEAMESSPRERRPGREGVVSIPSRRTILLNLADVQAIVKPGGILLPRVEDTARLRVVYNARTVADGAAALAAIADPAFDPDFEVILEPASDDRTGLPLDPNRFTATVTLEQGGYVVLSDTYYPGWRVFVDGEPQPLLRANYLFRAVAAPAGQHEIVFEYAPLSATVGLAISIASLVIWIGLWWLRKKTDSDMP
jgi:hypothetical protein